MSNIVYLPQVNNAILDNRIGAQFEGDFDDVAQWYVPGRCYQFPINCYRYDDMKLNYAKNADGVSKSVFGIGIRCFPVEWRLWPEYPNSPIKEAAWPYFVAFLKYLIDFIKPDWIALCNEPNTGVVAIATDSAGLGELIISWIDDRTAGDMHVKAKEAGAAYGKMVSYVTSALRLYKPTIHMHAGELMENEYTLDFISGMGAAICDALTFHHYMHYPGDFTSITRWINSIRNITNLPLGVSETGIRSQTYNDEIDRRKGEWMYYQIKNRVSLGLEIFLSYTLGGNGYDNTDVAPGAAWELFRSV